VRIGNSSVTSIGGKVGWTTLSDGRFKKNIQEDVPGLAFITKLRPVTYTLDIAALDKASGNADQGSLEEGSAKAAAAKEKHTGFVAQEVEKAATDIKYDFNGVDKPKNDKDLYGLRYAEFVVPLVKAVQELDAENKDLKARIERLEQLIRRNTNPLTSASLEQNNPNPISGTTTIRYSVPQTATSARLILTNAKGQLIKTVTISNRGSGQLSLNTAALAAGTYNYTLHVDGKQADSKRLIIAR
jgi:trimeric autotransporter adhesin